MAFHETLPPRLVELVRQAKDQILARPELFAMPRCAQQAPCGTALCIGGHMAVLDKPKIYGKRRSIDRVDDDIRRWIDKHCWRADHQDEWTELLVEDFWPARFNPKSAESAAERIDYWLETGK